MRCLRIVFDDKKSHFEDFLEGDGSVSTHHQNITFLAIEMFKVVKGISLQIVTEIFQFRDVMPYQLIKQTYFQIPSVHSIVNGTESFSDQNTRKLYLIK